MIRTIKPEAANIRTNAGKAIQSSPVIITNDGYDPPIQRLRTNAGKAIQVVTPSQQIVEVVRPELMRVGGKPRTSGAIADTKTQLQNKCLIGWTGDSKDSDIGTIRGLNVAGTVQSSVKKLGVNALSYSGTDSTAVEFRLNESLKKAKIYSISCWCRWNTFNFAGPWGQWGGVVPNWDERSGLRTYCLNTGSSPSKLYFDLWDGVSGNPGGVSISTTTNLSINTWYHFIFEINNTFLKIYVNGILEATSGTFSSSLDLWSTGQNFRLAGYGLTDSVTQLNGYLDEFYILNGALSQVEIDWLYNSGNGNTLL